MKNSIIKEMLIGNRGSNENIKIDKNEIWKKAISKLDKYLEQIQKEFSPEHLKLFNAFEEEIHTVIAEESNTFYIEGFKLGLLIGIECAE